ncbi:hypothetical protein BSKO_00707 [Bryopsis sp. KO-2023]|nr:hypothetical protein BSKO_00707 [Bryopsis sp. KO-2023]
MERGGRGRKKWRTEKWGGFAGIDRCTEVDSAPLKLFGLAATVFDNAEVAEYIERGEHLVPHPSAPAVTMDRFDVRLLLDTGVDEARKRESGFLIEEGDVDREELDFERYRDMSDARVSEEEEEEENLDRRSKGVIIPYDYGSEMHHTPKSGVPTEPCFVPDFAVPEHLINATPTSERIHKLMSQTARFVREAGGQAEVMLRVKQGNNPNFRFLLPDDQMFTYYRWLVEENPQPASPPVKEDVHGKEAAESSRHEEVRVVGAERSGSLPSALQPLQSYNSCGSHEEETPSSSLPQPLPSQTFEDGQRVDSEAVCHSNGGKPIDEIAHLDGGCEGDGTSPTASSPEHDALDIQMQKENASSMDSAEMEADNDCKEENERGKDGGASPEPGVPGVDDVPEVDGQLSAETRGIVEKLILFIQRNGVRFERVVRAREKTNPKFGFMLPWHPHHPEYKRHLIRALGQEIAEEVFSSWDAGAIDGVNREPVAAAPTALPLLGCDSKAAEQVEHQPAKESGLLQCEQKKPFIPERQKRDSPGERPTIGGKQTPSPPRCVGEGPHLAVIKANPRFGAKVPKKEDADHPEQVDAKSGTPSQTESKPDEDTNTERMPNGTSAASKLTDGDMVTSPQNKAEESSQANQTQPRKVESPPQTNRQLSAEEKRAQRRLKARMLLEKTQAEKLRSEVARRTQRARAVLDHRQAFLNDDDDGSIVGDEKECGSDSNEFPVCVGAGPLPCPPSELPALTEVVSSAAEHAKRHQEAFVATLRDPTQVISRAQPSASNSANGQEDGGSHDRKSKRRSTSPRQSLRKRHRDDRESSEHRKRSSGRSKHKRHKRKGDRHSGHRRRRSTSTSSDSDGGGGRGSRKRVR